MRRYLSDKQIFLASGAPSLALHPVFRGFASNPVDPTIVSFALRYNKLFLCALESWQKPA